MQPKHVITALLLCLILISCKEENYRGWTNVEVIATDFETGEPYQNLRINIRKWNNQLGPNQSEFFIGTTDENGSVRFEFKRKKNSSFSLSIMDNQTSYWYYEGGQDTILVNRENYHWMRFGDEMTLNIQIARSGVVTVVGAAEPCNDQQKFFGWVESLDDPNLGFFYLPGSECQALYNNYTYKLMPGNYEYHYDYEVQPGVDTTVQETFYLGSLDTFEIVMPF